MDQPKNPSVMIEYETGTPLGRLRTDSDTRSDDYLGNGFWKPRIWRDRRHLWVWLSPSLEERRTHSNMQWVSAPYKLQLGLLHPRRSILRNDLLWNCDPLR